MIEEFRKKFMLDQLALYENKSWIVSVRPIQITVGSLVISAKGNVDSLSKMDIGEGTSFFECCRFGENLLKKTFKPIKFNYLALMLVDPLVHFHLIPRYDRSIEFGKNNYSDDAWPKPIDILHCCGADPKKVLEKLKEQGNY